MDLKLELSLKGDGDDLKFQFAKDHTGPRFQSKETDTMFILTAQIRGYMREQIKIDINKDGTVITIGGEKSTEEVMIMVGWKVYKKGIEIMKFRKAFRIPDGVILDNIRANFNEDEYMLSILMPKKVKGIVGIGIEEMVEPELVLQDPETLPATSKQIKKRVTFKEEESIRDPKQKIAEENGIESAEERDVADNKMTHNADLPCLASDVDRDVVQEQRTTHEIPRGDDKMSGEMKQTNQETPKPECNQICDQVESSQQKDQDQESVDQVNGKQVHHEKESGNQEKEEESALEKTEAQEGEKAKTEEPQKKSNIFVPLVAGGSAMLVSLVVFAIHATKTKNQQDKRKD
nr:microtubule-associated protein 1B-like [Ipomoea batatas]